jgi:hypothetical protein
MKLPNGDHAIVEDKKLLEYALSPDHPVGRGHAELFEALLSITRDNYGVLKSALLKAATELEATVGQFTAFGKKYEMRIPMVGPRGPKTVLAIWLIENGEDRPRLITCYVE